MPGDANAHRGASHRRFSVVATSRTQVGDPAPIGRIFGAVALVAALVLGSWLLIEAATSEIDALERRHRHDFAEQ